MEPYNHVPLRTGQKNNLQETPTYHPVYQQNHHIKKDDVQATNQEGQDLANKMANLYTRPEENDALKEFTVSKSDPKYQTLPYNTKFTVNLLPNRIVRSDGVDDKDDHISNVNMQSTHMTVHSAPLSIVNKNIATPLNQNDLISKRQSGNDGSNGTVSNGVTYQVRGPAQLFYHTKPDFLPETHQQRSADVSPPFWDPIQHLPDLVHQSPARGAADHQRHRQASPVASSALSTPVHQHSAQQHPRSLSRQKSKASLASETGDKAASAPDPNRRRERSATAPLAADRAAAGRSQERYTS